MENTTCNASVLAGAAPVQIVTPISASKNLPWRSVHGGIRDLVGKNTKPEMGKEDEEEGILAVLISSSPLITCSYLPGSTGRQMTRVHGRLIAPGWWHLTKAQTIPPPVL
ncbi:hypothetical protein JOB18_028156 [Solea senegalensis]|uniref:Uncharacterized protein n=1 Tax=Solea senegalensis TaxID=28829 RepID=A0AAV6RBN6_SOLSE|nr:hypothetical protein JOB18_028156 [Solea senegalensis]